MDKKKKKRIVIVIVAAVLAVLLAVAGVVIASRYFPLFAPRVVEPVESIPESAPDPEPIANPIDFAALQATNPDTVAWIRIPGTSIDYFVMRTGEDKVEDYYLRRNVNGKKATAGCIYMQKYNRADFSDPNTVLYGHNMRNGTMFADLHKLEDADFFENNQYIFIYTPGHILTYQIVSAFLHNAKHLLMSYDFEAPNERAAYAQMILDPPEKTIRHVREGVEVTGNDHLLTLSTCYRGNDGRYLVVAKLISDQPTL